MTDSGRESRSTKLQLFEGMWLATKPSGAVACAKVVGGRLLIPYSFGGEGKLTGHYYDCRVVGDSLLCRFEHFDSANSGVLLLNVGPNETLKGGRWTIDQIPETVRRDISLLSESVQGMQAVIWVRMLKSEIPEWASRYFREDWPNKSLA